MIENDMTNQDPYVLALASLCEKRGGWKAVAAKIGTNDQTLYQITTGKKLPSGNPRGVGPKLRSLLDEHFPGWRDQQNTYPTHTAPTLIKYGTQEPAIQYNRNSATIQLAPIGQVIEDLARHMYGLDPPIRNAIGALVSGMCSNPDTASTTARTIQVMLDAQGKSEAQKSTNSKAA